MNDRELMELAAKASGNSVRTDLTYEAGIVINDGVIWNPLTNDGDALRLVVKLGLTLVVESDMVFCRNQRSDKAFREQSNDPYAATRRAIVRAAAEIGKLK